MFQIDNRFKSIECFSIHPLVARGLFPIPACTSDGEKLFSKAEYFVNSRGNQFGSEPLNDLLILNEFYTYRHLYLPRDKKYVVLAVILVL